MKWFKEKTKLSKSYKFWKYWMSFMIFENLGNTGNTAPRWSDQDSLHCTVSSLAWWNWYHWGARLVTPRRLVTCLDQTTASQCYQVPLYISPSSFYADRSCISLYSMSRTDNFLSIKTWKGVSLIIYSTEYITCSYLRNSNPSRESKPAWWYIKCSRVEFMLM